MTNDEYDKIELPALQQLQQKIQRAEADVAAGNTHDGDALLQALIEGDAVQMPPKGPLE